MWSKLVPGFVRANRKRKRNVRAHSKRKEEVQRLRVETRQQRDELRTARTRVGELTKRLLVGEAFDSAAVGAVRDMLDANQMIEARTLGQTLLSRDEQKRTGAIVMAIYLAQRGHYKSAIQYFRGQPEATVLKQAPSEYADSILASETENSSSRILELGLDMVAAQDYSMAFSYAKLLMKYRFNEKAISLVSRLPDASGLEEFLEKDELRDLCWFRDTLTARELPVGSEDCDVLFGLMDYKLLARDRTSGNIGDYVQTLAVVANIFRHQNVDFVTDDEQLLDQLNAYKDRVLPSNRIEGNASVKVGIIPVDRDFASGRKYSKPAWMISNGWFMHANGRGLFDFPYPDEIRPIFISFHINHNGFLTDEAVVYLKKHEPIGCRDWTTVYRLHDVGVDAFFSGCLTATIGLMYDPSTIGSSSAIANVEARLSKEEASNKSIENYRQSYDDVRGFSLAQGLGKADTMLAGYRKFGEIITSRLHCYLPCRSLGLSVDFRPRVASDIRFDGLDDLNEVRYNEIRAKLESKLAAALELIFIGQTEAEVRTFWKNIWEDEVTAAKQKLANAPSLHAGNISIGEVLQTITATKKTYGPNPASDWFNIAFATDENLSDELCATIASLISSSNSSLIVNVLTRGLDENYARSLSDTWPNTHFRFFDFSAVQYSEVRLQKHTTVATLDRLLLPEVLSEVDRLAYLDVDVLVRSDLSPLFELDMTNTPIAGSPTTYTGWKKGEDLLHVNAMKLDATTAQKLRLWAYSSGKVSFECFNAGVMVLNLNALRQSRFTEKTLAMVEEFGFHDQDAINFFCRGNFIPLDLKWNFIPSQAYCEDPAIVHWAGKIKPWDKFSVLYKNEYEMAQDVSNKNGSKIRDNFDMRSHKSASST